MEEAPRNPFPLYKFPLDSVCDNPIIGWKWIDETGQESAKTFATQGDALRDLTAYVHFLSHGPTLWQRMWWPVRYKLWPKVMELLRS